MQMGRLVPKETNFMKLKRKCKNHVRWGRGMYEFNFLMAKKFVWYVLLKSIYCRSIPQSSPIYFMDPLTNRFYLPKNL